MKLNNHGINVFLALWIKNDPELWAELRLVEINFLLDRIVKEYSFKELSVMYDTDESKLKELFQRILAKIDQYISSDVASHLHFINDNLESGEISTLKVRIFLN